MKLNYISEYINNKLEYNNLCNQVFELANSNTSNYPNYKNWFYNTHLPEIKNKKRDILLLILNNQIIGITSLKKDQKKICTIYIKDKYRNKKLSSLLLEESFKYLNTTKPLITIPENKLNYFTNISKKYDWKLTNTKPIKDNESISEYYYNE